MLIKEIYVPDHIKGKHRLLSLNPPLEISLRINYHTKYFSFVDENMGISVHESNLDRVVDEVIDQLVFIWEAYGLGNDGKMTAQAKKYAAYVRQRIKESELDE